MNWQANHQFVVLRQIRAFGNLGFSFAKADYLRFKFKQFCRVREYFTLKVVLFLLLHKCTKSRQGTALALAGGAKLAVPHLWVKYRMESVNFFQKLGHANLRCLIPKTSKKEYIYIYTYIYIYIYIYIKQKFVKFLPLK